MNRDAGASPRAGAGLGTLAQIACLLEVGAEKPGNVTPTRAFDDCDWLDFAIAAAQIAPVLDGAPGRPLGETIRDSVLRSVEATGQNVNLGIVLLLAPLAAASDDPTPVASSTLRRGLRDVLESLTAEDAANVWIAIRAAAPAGLGSVPHADLAGPAPEGLLAAMRLAADRDLVARQYTSAFDDVFGLGLGALERALSDGLEIEPAVVRVHLEFLAEFPDSLIARKRGAAEAAESSRRARAVLEAGWPGSPEAAKLLADLDGWLREDGHARNPGTSADLVSATLFLGLRIGMIATPVPRARGVRPAPR